MGKSKKITSYIKRTVLILTITTSILVAAVIMLNEYIRFSTQKARFKTNYIEEQKQYIKYVALNELDYIENQKLRLEDQVHNEIKLLANKAEELAVNLYNIHKGVKTESEIKKIITDAISSYRGQHAYSRIYITTLNGIGVKYPNHPEFTGKDLTLLKDDEGNSVVKTELNILQSKDEGFIFYNKGPNDQLKQKNKIAFIKKFKYFNWYFSTYDYLDNYYSDFKEEITYRISTLRFVNGGYVFLNQIDGTPLAMNGEIYTGSLNFFDGTDLKKQEMFEKELEAANSNSEGNYYYYKWNKIDDTIRIDKCSYSVLFPEWNWVLGAGFYLDDADVNIAKNFKNYRNDFTKNIILLFVLLIVIISLEVILVNRFNKKYLSDFNLFFKFFKKAAESNERLSIDRFYFEEFKDAAEAANSMIETKEKIVADLIVQQKRALESDQLKSAFLANMSHEIRTPMNAILGFSELLAYDEIEEENKLEYIDLIKSNGDNLLHLINDIIDLSKIEANQLLFKSKKFNAHAFINSSYLKNRSNLKKLVNNNLDFELINNLSPRLVVENDDQRIGQIIDNLLSNAFKFTKEGKVLIKTYNNDYSFFIEVSDTGIGIDKIQITHIFERFRQVNNDLQRVYGGTGLGLAITKSLVNMLKGKIEVESEIGKGTTFNVEIPIDFFQEH